MLVDTETDKVNTLVKLARWFTAARALVVVLMFAAGAVGTGVGFLLGEGAARARFSSQFLDHEKRLVSVELHVREAAAQNTRVLEMLGEVKGELRALRREARP